MRDAKTEIDPGLLSVACMNGVGPTLQANLARLGITRLQDLWFHLPLRYEDKTRITAISELRVGEQAQVEGYVDAIERSFRFRPQLRVAISDASHQTLVLRFFHFRGPQVEQLKPGTRIRCYGEVRHGAQGLEIVHPQYQRVDENTSGAVEERLTPIYPTTEGLGHKRLASLIEQALHKLPDAAALELIPAELCATHQLGSLRDALLFVHRPPPGANLARIAAGQHPAQQRLAFEELLTHQLSLKRLRARIRQHRAPVLRSKGDKRATLLAQLPFALTDAQQRVLQEIARDMTTAKPMLRLVQGDVGSGKTVVAALAALQAIESGAQVALVAPTELLAEQHLRSFMQWFAPLDIKLVWLAGKVQGKARRAALDALASDADIVIGTHALMQESVEFRHLGLAIIDEQHRFGVHQRMALRDKGRAPHQATQGRDMDVEGQHTTNGSSLTQIPHQLVLTATPIPRTLAMTAYADLDVSVINELPPGRPPVTTVAISNARRSEIVERIRAACAQGRQAYWVCTLIEESDVLEAQAAEVSYAELTATLPELRIGLVHGRLKPSEKQSVMQAFQNGELALLIATTVIEVGVDVPNASLMVIENAERLGLSQLHQLRGRVGRGNQASSCVLLYQMPLSGTARQRLEVIRETTDGFRIAEKDLELRGPGELLGTRQTGRLAFRIADLARDAKLLPAVQQVGSVLLENYPQQAEHLMARWIGSATRYASA